LFCSRWTYYKDKIILKQEDLLIIFNVF